MSNTPMDHEARIGRRANPPGHSASKCIRHTNGHTMRVKDDVAASHVKSGVWEYCAKHVWKMEQGK